jgi:hypothetical protein
MVILLPTNGSSSQVRPNDGPPADITPRPQGELGTFDKELLDLLRTEKGNPNNPSLAGPYRLRQLTSHVESPRNTKPDDAVVNARAHGCLSAPIRSISKMKVEDSVDSH